MIKLFKKFFYWYRNDTEIGHDGVRINKRPHISASGNLYWNVRDILFKNK